MALEAGFLCSLGNIIKKWFSWRNQMESSKELLRMIPSVDKIISHPNLSHFNSKNGSDLLTGVVRSVLAHIRLEILAGNIISQSELILDKIVALTIKKLESKLEPNLKPVINATGVVLHTNLGRAVLSNKAQDAINKVAGNYSNLEFNLNNGKRGSRYSHVEEILCELTGAEAALVVNNNAAAVLLVLSALAREGEVIVARGQLVEIGGSFRILEVMEQSGAKLVEVGATNKVYPKDYEQAITEETSMLLKVHTSNYAILGFTRDTTIQELAEIGKEHNLPVVEDLGSGFLVELDQLGINTNTSEPTVQSSIKAGAQIVTFSGDKLLGGPQAGIIVGEKAYIEKIKKHPLTRAVRVDKFTVAALEATLKPYQENTWMTEIPTLNMLSLGQNQIQVRSQKLAERLQRELGEAAKVTNTLGYSQVGGGALPTTYLPTALIGIKSDSLKSHNILEKLRAGKPSVIARIEDDRVLIDLRTVFIEQEDILVQAIVKVFRGT